MEKKEKIVYGCYTTTSICFFLCVIVEIFSKDNHMLVTHCILGIAFLLLASTHKNN